MPLGYWTSLINELCKFIQIKQKMLHRTNTSEQSRTLIYSEKSLSGLTEVLRDRQLYNKKDHIISSILEDVPRSFTKMAFKDIYGKQVINQQRNRTSIKYSGIGNGEVRAKYAQKTFFRALEEEQRLISRQNMQLLGLTIQKLQHAPKNKKNNGGETSETVVTSLQPNQIQNAENVPQSSQLSDKKLMYARRVRTVTKRPQTIAMRRKDSSSPDKMRRRSSMRPINIEYANPIYEARITSYRELIFKLQWSYGIFSQMDSQEQLKLDKKYKVYIGGGNNSPLIKELMKRRFWWQIVQDKGGNDINFLWTQLKVPDYFKKQENSPLWSINEHIRKPEDSFVKDLSKEFKIRSKSKKQKERQKQWQKQQQYLFKIMPQFETNIYQTAIRPYRSRPLYERQQLLCSRQVSSENEKVHNHLTANFHLGNKKALFYNLKQYYELTNGNLFKVIPLTFHIKKGNKDPQYKRFIAYHKKRQAHIKKQQKQMQNGEKVKQKLRNIWIVKPGELTNRGNGITVIDEVYELDGIMKGQKKHDNGTEKTFIVQLYIDRPFLYKRRKFDIRQYLMISQLHGVFKAYWFRQGYIRTTSYEFDVYNFDREIHLTNDAVQKYTPHYGRYEPGNKISFAQFQKYLDSNYKDKYNFEEEILPKMKAIAIDAVKSVFVKISPERKMHNFQIFGLDFMIDSQFTPWLIEFNTNPCLELSCPLLTRLIPQMLDQAFRITLDVVYPPPTHYPNTAKHLVPDASLQNLKWQLFFDERLQGQKLKQLYRKCKGDIMADIGDVSDDQVYQDTANQQLQLQQNL